jgi:hypothetical protein
MPLLKHAVVRRLNELLNTRIDACNEAILSTRAAFASDTKSSAGDKHEVGRAMVQQELDKLEAQRAKLLQLRQDLKQLPLDGLPERVGLGSLVVTDQGTYLIGIGWGAVDVDGEVCYAISLASPMGQALKDRTAGETVLVQGRSLVVLNVL